MDLKEYTLEEVARHNTPKDCWIVIDGGVYDVTEFADMHPGGAGIIHDYAGKDVTGMEAMDSTFVLCYVFVQCVLLVLNQGNLIDALVRVSAEFYGMHRHEVLMKFAPQLRIGSVKGGKSVVTQGAPGTVSKVPYAEPSVCQNFKSPYFKYFVLSC